MSQFDDERERSRAAILKRRAKLVAYAVAAGIAMPACGGKSEGEDGGGGATTGGSKTNQGGYGSTAGSVVCLHPASGSTYGGGAIGGSSICLSVCLGMPYGGQTLGGRPSAGAPSDGGEAGMAGEAGQAGSVGQGGTPPSYCLVPPAAPVPSPDDDDGAPP